MIEPQQLYPAIPPSLLTLAVGWLIRKVLLLEKDMHKRTSKAYADETFQRKDLCDNLHVEIKDDIKEIKSDLKEVVTWVRDGKK